MFPRKFRPGRKGRVNYDLFAANGTTIPIYVWISLSLNLGLRRDFTWRFVVADVQIPIIGADLLAHFGFLVDCQISRLLNRTTSISDHGHAVPTSIPSLMTIGSSVLAEFSQLTHPTGIRREVRHNTVHHIRNTPGPPVTSRQRRLAPDTLYVAKAEFDDILQDGTACRPEGSWSSALHLVPKKDNVWRPCGDYRTHNARSIPDCYTVRHIHDQLAGCTIFSKIDQVRAYHQIPVHPDDIEKTAIIMSFGLFEFSFMSFTPVFL